MRFQIPRWPNNPLERKNDVFDLWFSSGLVDLRCRLRELSGLLGLHTALAQRELMDCVVNFRFLFVTLYYAVYTSSFFT